MGTSVLSPQDCLAPSHGRHHHQFTDMVHTPASGPRSRSGRNSLQASIVQCIFPSPASDCARRNSSGAVIRAGEGHQNGVPGLLPVPGDRLPRHSSLRRSASQSSFSPSPRHSASTASSPSRHPTPSPVSPSPCSPFTTGSNAKLKASRSASSALLPRGAQASVGVLGSERLHSSNGRLPFKVVQGNGVVNGTSHECQNDAIPLKHGDMQTTKFLDANSGVGKKRGGREHRCDTRKPAHRDLSSRQGVLGKDIRNVSLKEDIGVKERRREVEGKKAGNRRREERGNTHEKDAGETPVVTILQRPKDKGAADELIAKFFEMVDGSSSVNAFSHLENQKKEGSSEDSTCSSENGGSDDLSDSAFHHDTIVPWMQNPHDRPRFPIFTTKKHEHSHGVELLRQRSDARMVESSPGHYLSEMKETSIVQSEIEVTVDSGDFSGHIDSMLGIDGWLPVVGNERWAGSAYTNSPPPSSLPLPKFSIKQFRTSSLELSPIKYQYMWSSAVHDQEHGWDAAFATKDLRRILNLDSC